LQEQKVNKTARFWKYTGNHHCGKDCERKDSHGFGLGLISAMAYWGDSEEDYQAPLTHEETKLIKVSHHKGDSFGHEVTVSAPAEIWEKGEQALELAKKFLSVVAK
jgi:hypothetical protein